MPQKASKKTTITADHPAVEQYCALLREFKNQRVKHEGAVSTAFENLLTHLANKGQEYLGLYPPIEKLTTLAQRLELGFLNVGEQRSNIPLTKAAKGMSVYYSGTLAHAH
jgi:hypothetical protein